MYIKKVVVTIPAFNEERSIGDVIEDIRMVMEKENYDYSIIVVDDGSSDRTADVAKDSGAIVISHPTNRGLGETFRTEIKECIKLNPDVIIHIDADGQYSPMEIPGLLNEIENGNDLVLGSRFKGSIEHMPLIKKLGNRMFSNAISRIIGFKVTDAQTGFRAFTRELAEKIEIKSGHTYTQEQIIKSVREKFRIKEVPINFAKRKCGESRLIGSTLAYAVKAWSNIFRIYRDYDPLKTFGLLGAIALLPGFIIGLWLMWFFLNEGIMPFTGLLVLTFLLITIGVIFILFGFIADMKREI